MRAATDGNLPDDIEQLKAAIQLCADDEVFFIHIGGNGEIIPCLMLNDTFYYACADLEEIDWSQVVRLRDRIRANGWPEAIRWAQEEGREHFRMLPIPPIQESMSKWDKMRRMEWQAGAETMRRLCATACSDMIIPDISTRIMSLHIPEWESE